jgi:hypothetical protein
MFLLLSGLTAPAAKANGTVLANVYNSTAKITIPIRMGGLNVNNQGYGYIKIRDYHNPGTVAGLQWVFKTNNYTRSGAHYNMNAWVQKYVCDAYGGCSIQDEVQIRGVVDPQSYSTYYGFAVGGVLGAQNAYCFGFLPRCPTWVAAAASSKAQSTANRVAGADQTVTSAAALESADSPAELRAAGAFQDPNAANVYYARTYGPTR